ncbi:NAD(P)H-dependent flavin oxidoreductase [Brackiella oedipodis]|uniref:NAD(P)H-dependent flavin oxidoreductase n=1 Tax=Brackiella oedipodis TaxID=124225 RepID=UPI00068407EF|nr:nitronate monooxygenase [Brackiella oedipodis]
MNAASQSLIQAFGIQYPIIQAPMTGTTTPELALAVHRAGALGSLGLGALNQAACQKQLQVLQAQGVRTVNLNFFCHQDPVRDDAKEQAWLAFLAPYYEQAGGQVPKQLNCIYESFNSCDWQLELLLEFKPTVASFHFGLPNEQAIKRLHEAGILLVACATNLEEALQAQAAGMDYVVAQGYEAGGHRGVFNPQQDDCMGTLALVETLVRHCKLPIIAAGGIMTGDSIQAVLQLGAAAVQMGTAFVACPESNANDAYRKALNSAAAQHTVVTEMISGRPARGIPNTLTQLAAQAPTLPGYPCVYDASKQLNALASQQGVHDYGAFWAGQGAAQVRTLPATELVQQLVQEAGW